RRPGAAATAGSLACRPWSGGQLSQTEGEPYGPRLPEVEQLVLAEHVDPDAVPQLQVQPLAQRARQLEDERVVALVVLPERREVRGEEHAVRIPAKLEGELGEDEQLPRQRRAQGQLH